MNNNTFNITEAFVQKVNESDNEALGRFFGVSENTIKKWRANTAFPTILQIQPLIDEAFKKGVLRLQETTQAEEAPPQGRTRPQTLEEEQAEIKANTQKPEPVRVEAPATTEQLAKKLEAAPSFHLLIPTARDFAPVTVESILGNWKRTLPEEFWPFLAPLKVEHDTYIHKARNTLAMVFLDSGKEWSFWMDSDMIAPMGNPAWFRAKTGAKHADTFTGPAALKQLTRWGKSFVGAPYAARNGSGKLVVSGGEEQEKVSDEEKEAVETLKKRGHSNKIVKVKWIGFGCVAIHRKVFLDILEKVPEVRAKEGHAHGFFNPTPNGGPAGEDIAFCLRAAKAGHPPHMDLSVPLGHIGRVSFNTTHAHE